MSNPSQVYSTSWRGQPAIALETPLLRLMTVPGMGAKIVSIFDKRVGHEWLLPPVDREFKPVPYGAPFVEQDMSGWDEMFPTITACAYPGDGVYGGAQLPDHGEVWSLAWQVDDTQADAVTLSTSGRALPYRLTRTIRVLDDHMLRLAFEVLNVGSQPFSGLWAAHPQFMVDDETRIVLPPSVDHVINVHITPEWATSGRAYSWPRAQTDTGEWVALDQIRSAEHRRCRKFYAPPDIPVSWAALRQGRDGCWIRLSWEASKMPYLGIWVDEGVYNAAPTAALEPSTGYYDSLQTACQYDCVMQFLPDAPRAWYLDIELGSGARSARDA